MNATPYPVKMEEPYCDNDAERDEMQNVHGALPYMGTFGKHPPPNMAMFYPQLTYDLHPIMLGHRRRSAQGEKQQDMIDPLEEHPALHSAAALGGLHLKEPRYKSPKVKGSKRRVADLQEESYGLVDTTPGAIEDSAADFAAKNRKSFFCRSCGKTFKFQTSLLRHNNKVHISKYQCPTCSRVFSRQAYLDVHTSKQGSSCYLDPALRMSRGRPQLQALTATSD